MVRQRLVPYTVHIGHFTHFKGFGLSKVFSCEVISFHLGIHLAAAINKLGDHISHVAIKYVSHFHYIIKG